MLISESHNQTSHAHFWPYPFKKIFDLLLVNVDLYQLEKKTKNQTILFICSGDMVD